MTPELLDAIAGWELPDGVIDAVEPFDVERHLAEVVEHRLLGVLAAAVEAGDIEVDRPAAVADAHREAMAQALLLEDRLLDVVEALDRADVAVRVLKGPALAHLLGHPERRVFGDIDLLVAADGLPEAAAALEVVGAQRMQAPVSPTWERRFAKSVTMKWSGVEIDLHRTLAPGPYGHTIDGAALFAAPATVAIGGVEVSTLSAERHLVHAAVHAALGDVSPRLGNVRDIALLLDRPGIDLDAVMAMVAAWDLDAPFAIGVAAASRIGAVPNGVADWAVHHRASRRHRALLASYAEREGRFRRQALASLRVLPWRDRLAFARSLSGARRG